MNHAWLSYISYLSFTPGYNYQQLNTVSEDTWEILSTVLYALERYFALNIHIGVKNKTKQNAR